LLGAHFDVGTGHLAVHDPASQSFAPVDAEILQRVAVPAE
jgi:hypothetical protein